MTSRKRLRQFFTGRPEQGSETPVTGSDAAGLSAGNQASTGKTGARGARSSGERQRKRKHLLETLESRQMLAGPQLIGIQPNEGDLIVQGSILNVAPRALTFRFDEVQQIDPATFGGIQITRAGSDDTFGTADDVRVVPGLVTLGDIKSNEVVVRFAENLPDDKYRIDLFSFDDPDRGIVALRNAAGEALQPSLPDARTETVEFELNLGALVEAVVPQPVVRLANGSLEQRRNEVLVYFNEDPLFVENDPATGLPTERSAENPRFYQLLLTQDTVRTTDDVLYFPQRVIYDSATHTARLIFASDINTLPGVPLGGGTFRLRVGTAVDSRSELIVTPTDFAIAPSVTSDLRIASDVAVTFRSKVFGENASGRQIRFINTGAAGLSVSLVASNVVFNLGGTTPTLAQLRAVVLATPAVNNVIELLFSQGGVADAGATLRVPANIISAPPLVMTAVGDTLTSALDVGVFGLQGEPITSIKLRESVRSQPFLFQLPGATSDPGRLAVPEASGGGLLQTINANFGPDTTTGITEIPYNFRNVYETAGSTSFVNQITEVQKTRVREALSLWANYLGVQFRETTDSGITFARGEINRLTARPGTQLTAPAVLDSALRIDPTFAQSAMVLSNQVSFGTSYGEDFFRKTMAGIGFLLGLEQATELTAQSLMSLSSGFLNASINLPSDLEPSFPGNYDILHGRHVHRPESNDIDLYRFEVNLGPGISSGTLTAETFAERLPDSSLLDTTLTLFQEVKASVTTDFSVGSSLAVKFTAVQPGSIGNNARIEIVQTTRQPADTAIRIRRTLDDAGQVTPNGIIVDIPRRSASITSVPVGDIVNAINNDPFASTLFSGEIVVGSASTDISGSSLLNPILLSGGGLVQIARNDDYFSEDSLLRTSLSNGVYYIGVASSGNNSYDPTIPGSGFGGTTEGAYELLLKFEPLVNEFDSIRDLDSARAGVPGTAVDGDGDGVPGGVKNFWFQTRPLERTIAITGNGAAIVAGQTFTITGANGVVRRFEFVPTGGTAAPGNVAVSYSPGPPAASGSPTPASSLAANIRSAINSVQSDTGVRAAVSTTSNNVLTLSGERSIQFSTNFRGAEIFGRTIFVDKTAGVVADGSEARPFNNISNPAVPNAFSATFESDIVRIVGNGGADRNPGTTADNFSYQIGTNETGGGTLEDGRNMLVPRGVTVMIDAGAAFKLRNSAITVGSTSLSIDRSGGALQVLGTPRLVDLTDPVISGNSVTNRGIVPRLANGDFVSGSAIFTSTRDRSVDTPVAGNSAAPTPGNWGGLIFRRDLDQAAGREDLEDQGIFLQTVNHADIRFGGGANILIESVQQAVNPIQMINLRPNVTFNTIQRSANAAMSAAPDSFEETSFQAPRFQADGTFTADYDRVGPDINNNQLISNSINGLFIRVETSPTTPPRQLTVAGRFDDVDIVHYIAENVFIAGTPGGSIQDGIRPDVISVASQRLAAGQLPAGTYDYRVTFVDSFGFESLASNPTTAITVANASSVRLINIPTVPSGSSYLFRRIYRRDAAGAYRVVGQLDSSTNEFIDDGTRTGGFLDLTRTGVRGRLDGSLVIDPGSVVKLTGARIELGQGTQLLAEGTESKPIIFTSVLDDRFGAGGTFDTNNDRTATSQGATPARGNWSGIYASPTANISLDNSVVAFGGGVSLLEGGQSRGFAALELQQATARVTNSRFENNADGQLGAGPVGRNGRLNVTPSTIFARFTQPVIVGNTFVDNRGSIIDIDSDSFGDNLNVDLGRQTGPIGRLSDLDDNHGPLVRRNVTDSVASDAGGSVQLNGMEVRGGILSTGSIWDDTDIVHMLFDSIVVGNLISNSGLRLKSRPDESLVIKLSGGGNANSATVGTGFTATGSPSSITDRIGGTIQVLGLPGAPVIMTSIHDDSVGAGRRIDGTQQTDTNGNSISSRPSTNDWRSLYFDEFSNDRNVAVILEQELSTAIAPGLNGTVDNAQYLGELAERVTASDEVLRLGFEVQGFLSAPGDIDVYSFDGTAGTSVWIDIDKTTYMLDTVIEILDSSGNVLGRVDNSTAEVDDPSLIPSLSTELVGKIGSLQGSADVLTERGAGGLYQDFGTINSRDAGLRLSLPGTTGTRSVYYFRVRSASVNPSDAQGGLTRGAYSFQVRLQEAQEFPGSVVKFADIRYSNHGIHLRGLPGTSPLLGEAQENEGAAGGGNNNTIDTITLGANTRADRPQFLGNVAQSNNGTFGVGGSLSSSFDIDFFQFDVDFAGQLGALQKPMVFDVDYADGFNRPDTNISVFYDPDGEGGPTAPRLILFGSSSNIFEDQSSPLGANIGEILARGSVSTGDPFIGPVSLPEGSYYVGVTSAGRVPTELTANPLLRREPINSIQRIFDDRVGLVGPGTAQGPLLPQMFTDAAITAGGFTRTNDRSGDLGHGLAQPFDNSVAGLTLTDVIISEVESGNLPPGQDLDATGFWSLADNPSIGGAFSGGFQNTSTTIPHTTVRGSLVNQLADWFSFVIPADGTRVILDIDEGHDIFNPTSPASADFDLVLLTRNPATGGFQQVPGRALRFSISSTFDGRAGSNSVLDPFFDGSLTAGEYFVGVVKDTTVVTVDNNGISLSGPNTPNGQYLLHVSVENHPINSTGNGGESIFFNRAAATASGSLVSEAFDLGGYVAADEPVFYYNYFFAPASGDSVVVRITSDQNPTGVALTNTLQNTQNALGTNEIWLQNRVSLRDFAGQSGVRVTFDYSISPTAGLLNEGLYLDDFIVGFAERGEMISNARGGEAGFTFATGGVSGEYQLEMRPATEFGTPVRRAAGLGFIDGIQLTRTFDTNDRHAQQVTLVAPAGNQISDGDLFVIGDGLNSITFEFSTDATFAFGNVRVPFTPTDSAAVVAANLIAAINAPSTQTRLNIEAASASGIVTGAVTDARVNLSGNATGSFLAVDSAADAPPAGTPLTTGADGFLQMPAIFFGGLGDFNTVRAQGQVIVDSNRISDVHAIGIWAQPAPRSVDPADAPIGDFNFLSTPRLGPTPAGGVINFPTLNDSVLGGLVPGVVVVNNVIDQANYTGVKIDGQTRPEVVQLTETLLGFTALCDGDLLIVDAANTRVIFEFDDLGAAPTTACGSGQLGGNGFTDGHIPIYWRHQNSTGVYNGRGTPSTVDEVLTAIQQSINGSILVTNDLVGLVRASVGPSVFVSDVEETNAVYIDGVTNVSFVTALGGSVTTAPLAESPQPFARIVNNTIYGNDGTEAQFPQNGAAEPSDTIAQAIDTKRGRAHRGAYVTTATLGDNAGPLSPLRDVDLYQVNMTIGDRLIVDIDTLPAGPGTVLRVFDSNGVPQSFVTAGGVVSTTSRVGAIPSHLNPGTTAANPVVDVGNSRDGFIDFTATKKGTYYIGVSSAGNDAYDPLSLAGRVDGTGGTGQYQLGIEIYAERDFILSVDNGAASSTGSRGAQLHGTTFTITQIADFPPIPGLNTFGNRVTFEFSAGGGAFINGNINVPVAASARTPEISRAISQAIAGSVAQVTAAAFGGSAGGASVNTTSFGPDYPGGFGHENSVAGGAGTTELYAFVRNAARIELSDQARAAGLRLTPDQATPAFATEADQLLVESGVLIAQGSSSTVLNNVFINLHKSVMSENTTPGGPFTKGQEVIVTGNTFQYDDGRNSRMRADVPSPIPGGPSNVNGGTTDFNQTIPGSVLILENAGGDRFLPSRTSPIIDNAVDSLVERESFAVVKTALGIPVSNILAPDRDGNGQLRADDPNVANPGGLGANVFKDRGALDRADFVGPVAIIEAPRDNDAEGVDTDPATSFLQLNSGVYSEFRILLQDRGDSSDPFVGTGIDDNTVVVPVIPGLRAAGAAVALFEGDRLLTEGVDYTFSYDSTKKLVTLRPIAGLWRNDRAYRVSLNNQDRLVGRAPGAGQIADGDSFTIVDQDGGRVNFEYDSGYQIVAPEALSFTVPQAAANAGGISDGDLFSITGVNGTPVIFEFDRDGTRLPNTRAVSFAVTDTPAMIAASARTAIALAASQGLINVDVNVNATGPTVVVGSEAGIVLDASRSGLITVARTIALRVPTAGVGPSGVSDGNLLTISDGVNTVVFEFDTDNALNNPNNVAISLAGQAQAEGVVDAILTAIEASALRLNPVVTGNLLFLGLPATGTASVTGGNLAAVGLSRTPADGDTITFSPVGQTPVVLELTRDATVMDGNVAVPFTRLDTADQIASAIATAIRSQTIAGLNTAEVLANPGGQVAVGGNTLADGTPAFGLTLNTASTLISTGQPGVVGSTLLTIFGPLLAQLPIVGGSGIPDDSQFTLTDGVTTITFIYNLVNTGVANPTATVIPYQTFEDVNTIVASTLAAINASVLNITATDVGNGVISFGTIESNQLTFPPLPAIAAPLNARRGIVNDTEQVVITQGGQTRVFEFESAIAGGGVSAGAIPVVFQPSSTVDEVASILASAINNNRGNLSLSAEALAGGRVRITDTPQTTTITRVAPNSPAPSTISVSGQPGGAVAIPFTGAFTPEDVKRSIINTINDASANGTTSLVATDRGGSTFFIENGVFIDGPLDHYFLQGIKDNSGQLLEPTRADRTTQFTLLLPTVGLDYGDAPDRLNGVPGRYPTFLSSDGPRHVVSDEVRLGRLIDVDSDGVPNSAANGDDTTIFIDGTTGSVFAPTLQNGFVEVAFNLPVDINTADGATITLSSGVDTATFEFDTDGIFNENNFAVAVNTAGVVNRSVVATAFVKALRESNLRPADVVNAGNTVRVVTDDEDGVSFISDANPTGVINPGLTLPISVTVTGGGVLEAWIDFNADGDFSDPGEQIINGDTAGAIFSANPTRTPVTREFIITVPATAPRVSIPTATYARFRISAEGGLSPTGLALSGEVEDYRLTILPGSPPIVTPQNSVLNYTVDEDSILQARDADGTLTPNAPNDNGALAAIRDPDGDVVEVFASDIGARTLLDSTGAEAGDLVLFDDGTFVFTPLPDFFGTTSFTFRATDVKPADPSTQLVSQRPITVNITVNPVNDRPFVSGAAPTVTRTIPEDSAQTFTTADLTRFYSPGPTNEANQTLVIQSAGVNGQGFQTLLGGTLTLIDGNLRYTPPANFPGPGPDRFTYVVADNPNDANQLVQSALTLGTVVINITAVNDPPIAGTDTFDADEDAPLNIPVSGAGSILVNDLPGPPDEVAAGQTLTLVASDFPKATDRGGTITLVNNGTRLVYQPPANFSGQDQFTYRVTDNGVPPATATGTVLINVGGDNDPPIFVGINGDTNVRSLQFTESKDVEQVLNFNLSSWFTDPEGDASTYQVTSSDPTLVRTEVLRDNASGLSTLRLTLPPRFLTVPSIDLSLNILATNVGGPSSTVQVPVRVVNTPDPPAVTGTLDPLVVAEDEVVVRDLSTIFRDPDGAQLTYRVARIGSLLNPTAQQIAASPLLESISFSGNNMTIRLDGDASGSVEIQIAATDGSFEVTDTFVLTVQAAPDAPRGVADFYNVPIGARFEVIDPTQGLLGNDVDPDSDVFPGSTRRVRVDLASVTQPSRGSVVVNADGTFVYTNTGGAAEEVDTFTYRPIDPTGLIGNVVTVTLNLGRSRYQNPIPGFNFDVTANGAITPIDALRIINRLSRARSSEIAVSDLTTPPPDFLDVNGDGFVRPFDALLVINEISRRNRQQLGQAEGESLNAKIASTVTYAAPTNVGLTQSNQVAPLATVGDAEDTDGSYDPFAAGFDIVDNRAEKSSYELIQLHQSSDSAKASATAVDEALTEWFAKD